MTFFSRAPARRPRWMHALARVGLLLALVSGAWGMGGVFHEVRAQERASACTDTLATAEKAYRNRNYQEAVKLASQCTNDEVVGDETAIRAHRLITLSSLRQGDLVQARTAVISILQIDPEYTADPVNDPPAYDLFISMIREDQQTGETADKEETEPADEAEPDETRPADEAESEEDEAQTSEPGPSPPQPTRAVAPFFIKPLGVGVSDYTGDMPAQTVGHPFDLQEFSRGSGFPFMLHGELGYQFAPRWALVLGFQAGNYPIVGYNTGNNDISDSWRYTPQLLVRYAFGTIGESVVVYLDGGASATFGGEGIAEPGYGPSVGGGVDIPVSNALSLYVESRFNFAFPDDAIDGIDASNFDNVQGSSTGPFDSVNQLLGVGLRVRLGGS